MIYFLIHSDQEKTKLKFFPLSSVNLVIHIWFKIPNFQIYFVLLVMSIFRKEYKTIVRSFQIFVNVWMEETLVKSGEGGPGESGGSEYLNLPSFSSFVVGGVNVSS